MMGFRWLTCALVVAAAAVCLSAADDSGVRGHVRDPEGLPLPGVAITIIKAAGAARPQGAPVTTDAEGTFFIRLPPGSYRVRATLEGFEPIDRPITVTTGASLQLDLQMRLAGVKEQVTVKGDTPQPVLGTPSPAAPVTATREVVDSGMLPNAQYDDVLPLLPNVVRGPDGLIAVAGASAPQGGLLVNGINLSDPITGEAVLLLPLEAIDSVDVFSGGYPAEAGRATGGVTSVHTLAGADKRRWSANSFFPRIKFVGVGPHGVDSWEPNVGLSGPLFDGRLSVEQAISYRYNRNRFETLWGEQESTYAALMSWTQADWRVSDRNHLAATLSFDPQRDDAAGITAFTSAASAPRVRVGGWSVALTDRLTVGDRSTLDVRASAVRGRLAVAPTGTDPYEVGHDITRGSYFDRRDLDGTRSEISAAWGWTAPSGDQVLTGVSTATESIDGTEGAGAIDLLNSAGQLVRRVSFTASAVPVSADARQFGAFIQDRWTPRSWLTLDAGVRYDRSSTAHAALSPRAAWTIKLPGGASTIGGSVGMYADKIPLSAYAFASGQPRVVQTWDATGALTSSILYTNVRSGTWSTPTASRWDLEFDHRLNQAWQVRAKYQERHGRHELVVDPVVDSSQSGSLVLGGGGVSSARSLEMTAAYRASGGGNEVYLSYVRSQSLGSSNTLAAVDGMFRTAYVQASQVAPLRADVPHRLLAWGVFHLPARISVAPFIEVRSGFPFTPIDEIWNYAAPVGSARLPWFGALDLYVNKEMVVSPRLPEVRFGLKLYNVASVHTERDVQRDLARSDYGQTYNPIPRDFTFVFELLWGKK
jgi:hypothetical protein